MSYKVPSTDQSWRLHAACLTERPELFFPAKEDDQSAAILVCKSCPVAAQCLEYALSIPSLQGIWGGTGQKRRRAIRKGLVPRPFPARGDLAS